MTFEYLIIREMTRKKLNELGIEGWELVAIQTIPMFGTDFYFKRRIKED